MGRSSGLTLAAGAASDPHTRSLRRPKPVYSGQSVPLLLGIVLAYQSRARGSSPPSRVQLSKPLPIFSLPSSLSSALRLSLSGFAFSPRLDRNLSHAAASIHFSRVSI